MKLATCISLLSAFLFASTVQADDFSDIVNNGAPFRIRNTNKNLCVGDGGVIKPGANTFRMVDCGSDPTVETFTYDAATKQIKSVAKPGLCWNDGIQQLDYRVQSMLLLHPCSTSADAVNPRNQFTFLQSGSAVTVTSPNLDRFCMDDGGSYSPGGSPVWMQAACNKLTGLTWINTNQVFQLQRVTTPVATVVPQYVPDSTPVPTATLDDIMKRKAHFRILPMIKTNLCIGDGGATTAGDTIFKSLWCGSDSAAESFVYNPVTKQIESVAKTGLCWSSTDVGQPLRLDACAAEGVSAPGQEFVITELSWGNGRYVIIQKPSMAGGCLDEGPAWWPAGTDMPTAKVVTLSACNEGNLKEVSTWYQVFRLQPLSNPEPEPTTVTPSPEPAATEPEPTPASSLPSSAPSPSTAEPTPEPAASEPASTPTATPSASPSPSQGGPTPTIPQPPSPAPTPSVTVPVSDPEPTPSVSVPKPTAASPPKACGSD
ncbi:hypothetical protein Poli38472_001836 [Pythium oligandrum]|uniref:Ricin B lectin domain-containing protein n=1 Tax=Pythium oligandrum TaxID=41045 RepID=A0A8K1CVY3_PYTOL|nr:hypothetical protein Poli38472_001836 [Pythium oligandrum]|eukprot:TMW69680.1 hypothetical protein Poli38472_001836 [Pythium oligandrum]